MSKSIDKTVFWVYNVLNKRINTVHLNIALTIFVLYVLFVVGHISSEDMLGGKGKRGENPQQQPLPYLTFK